jgi:hypothetical protein
MNSNKAAAKSSEPASPGGRWAIDVQVSGDASSIKAKRDEVVLVLITGPDANRAEMRERAAELLEDAHDGVPAGAAGRGIPPVMQRVIRSLLAWAEEVKDGSPDAAWWAIAFMHSPTSPMLAHVGGEEPRVLSTSGAVAPQSNLLRGKNGVQVRAMGLRPGVQPTLSVTWATDPRDLGGAAVQADWQLEPREEEPEDAPELPEPPVMKLVEIVPASVVESAAAPEVEVTPPAAEAPTETSAPAGEPPSPTEAIITDDERRMLETIFSRSHAAEPTPAAATVEAEARPTIEADTSPQVEPDPRPQLEMTSFADAVEPSADSPLWDEPASASATPPTEETRDDDDTLLEAILADVDELPGSGLVVTSFDAQMEEAARVGDGVEAETSSLDEAAADAEIESIVLEESATEELGDEDADDAEDAGAEAEAAFSALFESAYESSTASTPPKGSSAEPAPAPAEAKSEPADDEPRLTWLSSAPHGATADKPADETAIKVFEPWSKGARTLRPARPLIIGPSKRNVAPAAEAADTTRAARPKRPRPQLVKLQRGTTDAPPTTRPVAPGDRALR